MDNYYNAGLVRYMASRQDDELCQPKNSDMELSDMYIVRILLAFVQPEKNKLFKTRIYYI